MTTINEINITSINLEIKYKGTDPPSPPIGDKWRGDIIGYIGSGGCIQFKEADASSETFVCICDNVQGGCSVSQQQECQNNKTINSCTSNSNCGALSMLQTGTVPDYYNIIKLSFWTGGSLTDTTVYKSIPAWLSKWRNNKDPWGRERKLLLSIGGQLGSGLNSTTAPPIINNIVSLCNNNEADGIDIDLESPGGTNKIILKTISDILEETLHKDKIITLVPEATYNYYSPTTGGYRDWLTSGKFSWVSPQFYNNSANSAQLDPINFPDHPGNKHFAEDIPYVMQFLYTLKKVYNIKDSQVGMLTPCTSCGANDSDDNSDKILWDMSELSRHIKANNIQHIGSWDLTYDGYIGIGQEKLSYPWAGTLAQLLLGEPETSCSYCPFDKKKTGIVRALNSPNGESDTACSRKCAVNIGDRKMTPLPKPASDNSGGGSSGGGDSNSSCTGEWKATNPVNSDSWCVTTCTSSGTPSTACYENGDISKPNKKSDNKYCYCTSA